MPCNPGDPCYGNNLPVTYKTYPKGCIPVNPDDCLSSNSVCYTGPALTNLSILGGDTLSVSLQKINQSLSGNIFGSGVTGQFAIFTGPSTLSSVPALSWTTNTLSVNGKLTVQTLDNSPIDTDKFVVYNNGVLEYRTGSQVLSDINGEPFITPGTVFQYWRGDKTWQTLDTSVVPENTNLYFTTARARNSISLTSTGSSGAATYDSVTGIINVPQYASASGSVPNTRTLTINGTAYDLSADRVWTIVPLRKRFIVGNVGFPSDGSTTWTDPDFNGSTLWLYRNKMLQDWVDPADGDSYYTLAGSTITFFPALSSLEKINLLIFKI